MSKLKLEHTRIVPVILLFLMVVMQTMAVATRDDEEVKKEVVIKIPPYPGVKKAVPPRKTRNAEVEKLRILVSTDPEQYQNFEIYPDKFIVWTTDSAATVKAIHDEEYIKRIEKDDDMWAITVMTNDPDQGRLLQNRLRNAKGTVRTENYVYYEDGTEQWPNAYFYLQLRESSDSVKLKSLTDSLEIKAIRDQGLSSGKYWRIKMTSKLKKSRVEVNDIILKNVNPVYCEPDWGGIQFVPA